jgi:hypothetical protein
LKILGLDPLKLTLDYTNGVGNSSNETYYAHVAIDVGVGAPFVTYAGFTAGLETIGVGLLGQSGFFENYCVTFSQSTRKFHIDV